jgi:para-nitrobenzyl esterase
MIPSVSRRLLIQSSLLLLAPALPAFGGAAERTTLPGPPFVTAETAQGRVRGGTSRGALAFKGLPYAGTVSGAGRFRAPPPPVGWKGVRDAIRLGPPALQKANATYGMEEPAYSENCLVLNVWTPAVADGKKRPVMFYCHGGGFVTGSAGSVAQDGSRLAATHDVVVVASNHRLGLMGYLYLEDRVADANAGMQDIVAALRWVKTNIEAFGGDPGNVTIFGESGGGAKVATLMAMPQAAGLFHKAGIQSGAWPRRMPKAVATETTSRLLHALKISADTLDKVPAGKLMELQFAAESGNGPLILPSDRQGGDAERPGHFAPVVDGTILPADPFEPAAPALSADIPLMIGYNRDEATFMNRETPETFSMDDARLAARLKQEFGDKGSSLAAAYRRAMPQASPSDLYIAIATARLFGNDTSIVAARKAQQPAPVFAYRYDYASNVPIKGSKATLRAGHATDIGSTFANIDIPGLQGDGPGLKEASNNMGALWTSFARDGVPSAPGAPVWPRYDSARQTMLIDSVCKVAQDPDGATREAWSSI